MPRSVLLRHDLPNGSWHYDWLIDPTGRGRPDDRNLIAFRLTVRPDQTADPFDASRLPDHRRLYLDFEGPLSGGDRGTVTRLAEWNSTFLLNTADAMRLRLETAQGPLALRGARTPNARPLWRFELCH